jgi:sporulation protein YunB
MIECCNNNIWYKKLRKKKFKKFATIFFTVILVLAIIIHYKNNVSVQIFNTCYDYASAYSTEAVNEAVLSSVSINTKYSDIVNVEKNLNGDIVLMQINSTNINIINKEISINTEELLKERLKNGIPIPFFSFSGIKLISGYGPKIFYKTVNVVSVSCNFDSVFKSVGINQTLHSIYLVVVCKVNIEIPSKNNEIIYENLVLLSESVLVGKVPEFYLNGNLFK